MEWNVKQINLLDKLLSFSNALNALIPIFEKEKIGWTNSSQYDEFDAVAEALFDSVIIKYLQDVHSLYSETEGYLYDFDIKKSKTGFFFTTQDGESEPPVFQRLEDNGKEFSYAVFLKQGAEYLLPIDGLAGFYFIK